VLLSSALRLTSRKNRLSFNRQSRSIGVYVDLLDRLLSGRSLRNYHSTVSERYPPWSIRLERHRESDRKFRHDLNAATARTKALQQACQFLMPSPISKASASVGAVRPLPHRATPASCAYADWPTATNAALSSSSNCTDRPDSTGIFATPPVLIAVPLLSCAGPYFAGTPHVADHI
jgi:hypothetical protein